MYYALIDIIGTTRVRTESQYLVISETGAQVTHFIKIAGPLIWCLISFSITKRDFSRLCENSQSKGPLPPLAVQQFC